MTVKFDQTSDIYVLPCSLCANGQKQTPIHHLTILSAMKFSYSFFALDGKSIGMGCERSSNQIEWLIISNLVWIGNFFVHFFPLPLEKYRLTLDAREKKSDSWTFFILSGSWAFVNKIDSFHSFTIGQFNSTMDIEREEKKNEHRMWYLKNRKIDGMFGHNRIYFSRSLNCKTHSVRQRQAAFIVLGTWSTLHFDLIIVPRFFPPVRGSVQALYNIQR